jgi:hypothetical protein
MTNPENDTHENDAHADERQEEQTEATEQLRDLEPEKDVKGGSGPRFD